MRLISCLQVYFLDPRWKRVAFHTTRIWVNNYFVSYLSVLLPSITDEGEFYDDPTSHGQWKCLGDQNFQARVKNFEQKSLIIQFKKPLKASAVDMC